MGQVSVPRGSSGGDTAASYVLMSASVALPNERVLTAGANITVLDGGPGGPVTISAAAGGAPINASYVVIGFDATLTAERALAVGAGLQLVDGGANANVTLSVGTNAITDALLRQGAATSVIGRSAGAAGNVADIAATVNGEVLRMAGGVLGFGDIPESSVTNLVADLAAINASIATKQANIQFEDEGVNLGTSGTATEVDFTGAGVTASRAANKVTVNIPGGAGSFAVTQVTANFPYPANRRQEVTLIDAAITALSKIIIVQAGMPDTAVNEGDMVDLLSLSAVPAAGSFRVKAGFDTPFAGPLTLNYAAA